MRKRGLVIGCLVTGFLLVAGAAVWAATRGGSRFPDTAAQSYSGAGAYGFSSVGALVATSSVVVSGTVVGVEQGHTRTRGRGPAATDRLLRVSVDEVAYRRDGPSELPAEILVFDGYWQAGEGYADEFLPWAAVGDVGYFFLRPQPGEAATPVFDPLIVSGRVLVGADGLQYATGSVWGDMSPEPTTSAELRRLIDAGVAAARSGAAEPVLVSVCEPSIPGDENSSPVCSRERPI